MSISPMQYLNFENSLAKYLNDEPKDTASAKVKASQYFTILNRIEYVIELDAKYSEAGFLSFWRKFNILYNQLHRNISTKDPIEVYFDNQIGIIEVKTEATEIKKPRSTKVAEAAKNEGKHSLDILAVIEARNKNEEKIAAKIQEFETKIKELFEYIKLAPEGERLIVKIKSYVSEDEIHEDFGKIYRKYKALNRARLGEFFFKEMDDLLDKLCDDFEKYIHENVYHQ